MYDFRMPPLFSINGHLRSHIFGLGNDPNYFSVVDYMMFKQKMKRLEDSKKYRDHLTIRKILVASYVESKFEYSKSRLY
jgi:hypothetical protein